MEQEKDRTKRSHVHGTLDVYEAFGVLESLSSSLLVTPLWASVFYPRNRDKIHTCSSGEAESRVARLNSSSLLFLLSAELFHIPNSDFCSSYHCRDGCKSDNVWDNTPVLQRSGVWAFHPVASLRTRSHVSLPGIYQDSGARERRKKEKEPWKTDWLFKKGQFHQDKTEM